MIEKIRLPALVLAPLAILSVFLAACGRSPSGTQAPTGEGTVQSEPVEAGEPAGPSGDGMLDNLFLQADSLLSGGATNEALACLEQGLAASESAADRQQIFNMIVRMLVFVGRLDDARDRMLDTCRKDPVLALGAIGLVYSHYSERLGDQKAAAEWTETVLAIPNIDPAIRRTMREWRLQSYIRLDDAEKAVAIAADLLHGAPADDAIVILQRGVDMLFDRKQTAIIERFLAEASKSITTDAATRHFMAATRLRLLAARGKWDVLARTLPSLAASLPDGDLQRVLRRILTAAAAARPASPSVDDLCLIVINGFTNKVQSASVAARLWAENAVRTAPAELPDRLGLLLAKQFPTSVSCGIFLNHFYEVAEDPETIREMKEIGDRLVPLAQDEDTRNAIRTMMLDACFLVEDYDGALKILRAGIAGRDKSWHDMAIAKVEAHKSLKENRPLDAIKSFRAFMATVEVSKDGDAPDPSTGVVHTKPMILGRNAKRIGDIYRDQVKDAASATAAYGEARKYYQAALEARPEPDALQLIRAEMAEIPQ